MKIRGQQDTFDSVEHRLQFGCTLTGIDGEEGVCRSGWTQTKYGFKAASSDEVPDGSVVEHTVKFGDFFQGKAFVEFVYVKDNHMDSLNSLSMVEISVDDQVVNKDPAADGIQTTRIPIPEGYHFVTWKYSKIHTERTLFWAAELFNITIVGVNTDAAQC